MTDESHRAAADAREDAATLPSPDDASGGSNVEGAETPPAPTPFDHPFFLPAVCIGFTLWFGYDTYIHPMEDHLDFNFYGFKVVLAASVWYGYLAFCEVKELPAQVWVLPGIFTLLAAWLGAEAFGLITLSELVEYPDISRWGFYLSAALIPISAFREWMRRRRQVAASASA